MSKYIVVVEKTKGDKLQWWGYEIVADDIEGAIGTVESSPKIWGDCNAWNIISIHKQWEIGGQMVNEVHIGRLM